MIKFGTDGWRAVISDEFTFDNVRVVAQAVADYLATHRLITHQAEMVVGYDTRFLSNRYAQLVSEVLVGNGIKVILSDRPIPTPVTSFTIKAKKLVGGIMITASHNPPHYNGIKLKTSYAGPAEPKITGEIEALLYRTTPKFIPFDNAKRDSRLKILDLRKPYLKYVQSFVDMNVIRKSRLKIMLDVMHGVSSGYLASILQGSLSRLKTINENPDPLFGGIQPEPLAHNLKELVSLTKKGRYDIGIANDGDGDRIGAVTEQGRFLTPGQILCLLLIHLVEDKKMSGGVVKTISNTSLIDKLALQYGLKLYETPVGFKHIAKLMGEEDILIGGEESGGIGVKGFIPERDGTLLALLLLEMMAMRRQSISEILADIEKRFGRLFYLREDLYYPEASRSDLTHLEKNPPDKLVGSPVKEIKSYDGLKIFDKSGNWLMLRLSGTEPILRIYAEASSLKRARELLEFGKRLAHIPYS